MKREQMVYSESCHFSEEKQRLRQDRENKKVRGLKERKKERKKTKH